MLCISLSSTLHYLFTIIKCSSSKLSFEVVINFVTTISFMNCKDFHMRNTTFNKY